MARATDRSESQVLNIFEALGLNNTDDTCPSQPNIQPESPRAPRQIYTSRLSDSSIPPPTGIIKDAKLEDAIK